MADLDDMEMMKCPHCGKEAPKDFFPLCSCEKDIKKGKKPAKKAAGKSKKPAKPEDPYEYDF
jgi:endogenous inhibitor of DNA gyrase (YacG/DUF329 family)